jgi:hypothetical protein
MGAQQTAADDLHSPDAVASANMGQHEATSDSAPLHFDKKWLQQQAPSA